MSDQMVLSWEEYIRHDGMALAELVRTGEVSPRELAVQAMEASARVNPLINAVIEVFDDVVTDPSKDGMNPSGAFHGVPMMLKDLGSRMKGRLQECGYAWMDNNIVEDDDLLTRNFRNAGFNLIGRTTTPEDGMAPPAGLPRQSLLASYPFAALQMAVDQFDYRPVGVD